MKYLDLHFKCSWFGEIHKTEKMSLRLLSNSFEIFLLITICQVNASEF